MHIALPLRTGAAVLAVTAVVAVTACSGDRNDAAPDPSVTGGAGASADRIAPKVLALTLFSAEATPWLDNRNFDTEIEVPGLNAEYPTVRCEGTDLCLATTGMGYANAASTVSALVNSDSLDLSGTYVIVNGIAGVSPDRGTLGSSHWAHYVVDAGLRHEIDPRQIPADWDTNVLPLSADSPADRADPAGAAGTEVYELNEALVDAAYDATRDVELTDSPEAARYRALYPQETAQREPFVSICDTQSADTYWHGSMLAENTAQWVEHISDGQATYCTSQMEDNAVLTALTRGDSAGLVDLDRVTVLRTASNFDREHPGQTPAESLNADSGGFLPATENGYRVASRFADTVIDGWDRWKDGVGV